MRVAVIVVTMMAATTPSIASQSCMSQAEARKHFASAHIYWHGPNHCWDATAPPHRQIQAREKNLSREVQRRNDRLKWQDSQDSLSPLLPDDGPVRSLRTPASWEVNRQEDDGAVTGTPWADRWVELRPSQSPLVARPVRVVQLSPTPVIEQKSAPVVSPQNVLVLAFFAFILTLGSIAVFRQDS
jgi:hypothetical protein